MTISNPYPLWPNRFRPQQSKEFKTRLVPFIPQVDTTDYEHSVYILTRRALGRLANLPSWHSLNMLEHSAPEMFDGQTTAETEAELHEVVSQWRHRGRCHTTRNDRIKPHHFLHHWQDDYRSSLSEWDQHMPESERSGMRIDELSSYGDDPDAWCISESDNVDLNLTSFAQDVWTALEIYNYGKYLSTIHWEEEEYTRGDVIRHIEERTGFSYDAGDAYGNAYFGLSHELIQDYGVDGRRMVHTKTAGDGNLQNEGREPENNDGY